ncbi:hypothetical protein [Aestuariivirga sp.]|uniref:hypothetical protein n=1 Tax=Aestuariivirga sp. TaxID=2650926 RepID=UPI0039E50695
MKKFSEFLNTLTKKSIPGAWNLEDIQGSSNAEIFLAHLQSDVIKNILNTIKGIVEGTISNSGNEGDFESLESCADYLCEFSTKFRTCVDDYYEPAIGSANDMGAKGIRA